jgi:hypothetical protein
MKIYLLFTCFIAALLHGAVFAQKIESSAEVKASKLSGRHLSFSENNGFPGLETLPLLRNGIQTHQQVSYDRSGDNYDHEYFPLYTEANGEVVIFDAFGPGLLSRQQMNIWHAETKGINIRYYFDDETRPRIDMDVSTFFSEENPLGIFKSPLADNGGTEYRVMYCPMFFKKRLKVSLTKEPGGPGPKEFNPWTGRYDSLPKRRNHWYQYTYQLFTQDSGNLSWSKPLDMSSVIDKWSKLGMVDEPKNGSTFNETSVSIKAGKSQEIVNLSGQGSIAEMKLSLMPLSKETLFNTWLKIYFDGHINPDVNAPLGSFFGSYPDSIHAIYSSLPVGYAAEKGMYCLFPMPYWKSARVVMENKSQTDIEKLAFKIVNDSTESGRYPRSQSAYFHAAFNQAFPRIEGHDYTYLQVTGRGHVVGHISQRWNTSMEENERTYFDGSRTPQIEGDGFEDDQGFGWGLKPKTFALFGSPVANGGSGCLYRFFISDLYVFYSGVKHGHQTYGPHSPLGHEGMYQVGQEQSVTFYYAVNAPGINLTDTMDAGNLNSEKKHHYRASGKSKIKTGTYWYDGELNNVLFRHPGITDNGRMVSGSSEFVVKIDPANKGVRLRRRTDKENNRQLANVYVDGQLITERPWYTVDYEKTFRNIRWYDTSFEIPEKYTAGKKKIHLKLEYVSSENGGIDEYYYWVYSYLPTDQ